MRIVIDDLTGPEIAALLEEHTAELRGISPSESKHAQDFDGLRRPEITFWTVWDDEELVGCGALQNLGDASTELNRRATYGAASPRCCYGTSSAKPATAASLASTWKPALCPSSNPPGASTASTASPSADRSPSTSPIPTASS